VIRMCQARVAKQVGRPRLRRQENLENDLRGLKMKRGRQTARNIETVAFAINEGNGLSGLQSRGVSKQGK
jgi:hypothetical protein